jgi:uncharacterized membrane protein
MAHFGYAANSVVIRFGVLHCLGLCMLLWPVFRKLPTWALAVLGAIIIAAGWYISANHIHTQLQWLYPLGITYPGFTSGDYFPLLPSMGWFFLGAVFGRTVYRSKESLLPKVNSQAPILRFLGLCGRHSLWIYLLHQPLLSGILSLVTLLK